MVNLFSGARILATRTHREYDFAVGDRVVARTRNRPASAADVGRHGLRSMVSRHATRRVVIDVVDADDVAQWQIELEPGDATSFSARVAHADGTPVGHARADGGMFRPFPVIELTDAEGARVGHATTKGTITFRGTDDQTIAVVAHEQPTRAAFGDPRWSLTFHRAELTPAQRALLLGAVIGREMPR